MSYYIVVKILKLNLTIFFANVEFLFFANELFGKMPITIIVLAVHSSSENFKLSILVLMGNVIARNCWRSFLL